jgi:hypothetical protein
MNALHQSSGKAPESKDFWKILVSIGAMALQHSFRILAEIKSGPVALLVLSVDNNFNTPSSAIVICSMSGPPEFVSNCGRELVSSSVKTDLNWVFSVSALSVADVAIFLLGVLSRDGQAYTTTPY